MLAVCVIISLGHYFPAVVIRELVCFSTKKEREREKKKKKKKREREKVSER